jgi:glycosyltransferase involved in cell wall biosynthesis
MSNPIKVLHTEWSDGWGGQEIRIINEMLIIRGKGIEVFLACRDHSIIKQKAQELNIKTFVLAFKGNTDLKTIFKLREIILSNKITFLNTHSGKDTWVGGISAKLTGIKFIRTRHLSTPISKSHFNFINEVADYIFTTGESVRDSMIASNRINPNKIKSIPTGIDCQIYNPAKYDRNKCREIFSLNDDEIVIGMVSVLRKFKRHDHFIKMVKNVIDRNPKKKIKVLIAGKGPQEKMINKMISELKLNTNVKMLGHLENVPQLMRALDIFILASDSGEGVSQSLMQALLMETAVISTDVGSTKDLHSDDNFILTDINNLKQMDDACDELVNSYKLRKTYQKKSRKYVMEHFSNEKMAKKIIKVYHYLDQK